MEESILFGADIDDRSLDDAVDEVNESFADATADVQADISGPDGMDLGGGLQSPSGDVGDDVAALVPMADYRNRLLEDILDETQAGGGMGDGDDDGGSRLRDILGGLGGGLGGAALGLGLGAAGGLGLGLGGALLGRLGGGNLFGNIKERIGQAIEGLRERIPDVGDLIPDLPNIGDLIPDFNLEAGAIAGGVGSLLGGGVAFGQRLLGGAGRFLGGLGRGVTGGLSGLAGIPSRVLGDLEGRGITDILGEGVGAGQMTLTSPLGGGPLLQNLFGGGQRTTPGQRAAAQARDQRFRQDPAANPSQINANVDVSIDPSGLDDLRRQIKRELEGDLVDQVVSQVERELSIGAGGF